MLCDYSLRDWSDDVSTSQGTPRIASNTRSKERVKEQILPGAYRESMALPTL